jgi:outer membrane lipoprotein-sorting protein
VAPIRRLSTQRLTALVLGLVAALVAGGAIAIAATGGGPKPPPKRLDAAVRDALAAPKVAGVTARIRFTNHLVDSAGLQGAGPLVNGASGRFWASPDGRVRLELQTDSGGGDAQVVLAGRRLSAYEPRSNTVYRATLPPDRAHKGDADGRGKAPSLAEIDRALGRISERAVVSAAQPGNVAGKPSYSVRVTPRDHGGLLGAAGLTWDAASGVPLGAAVYAAGSSSPVLELKATDVSYGPVAASTFSFAAPKGAKVVDLDQDHRRASAGSPRSKERKPATGLGAVRRAVAFPVAAPDRLAGKPRSQVRVIRSGAHPAALVVYGEGLGSVGVIESPADAKAKPSASPRHVSLPTVSINGTSGQELRTALGTAVRFERHGVSYVVLGSVTPAVAEAAARGI